MKKNISFCWVMMCTAFLLLSAMPARSQGVLTIQRYVVHQLLMLDEVSTATSFAYSLRRIKRTYTGYAVRIRTGSGTTQAEADVKFDADGIVSTNSTVIVTAAAASSGRSVGEELSFSAFKGTQPVYVTTWYDQGPTAYHAIQTTAAAQPELVLNSAGASNSKPSILFTGAQYLDVGQPIENLVNNGINGSFMIWTKPTSNSGQDSFGYWKSRLGFRWSIHLNWTDGLLYFDAAENCCVTKANRSVTNSVNVNLFKQYSFVRGSSFKTVRINSAATSLNNTSVTSTSDTGGGFYIGWTFNGTDPKYKGNLCEAIMFPTDLSNTTLQPIEADQIDFWSN